jgi:hypothetical protein
MGLTWVNGELMESPWYNYPPSHVNSIDCGSIKRLVRLGIMYSMRSKSLCSRVLNLLSRSWAAANLVMLERGHSREYAVECT